MGTTTKGHKDHVRKEISLSFDEVLRAVKHEKNPRDLRPNPELLRVLKTTGTDADGNALGGWSPFVLPDGSLDLPVVTITEKHGKTIPHVVRGAKRLGTIQKLTKEEFDQIFGNGVPCYVIADSDVTETIALDQDTFEKFGRSVRIDQYLKLRGAKMAPLDASRKLGFTSRWPAGEYLYQGAGNVKVNGKDGKATTVLELYVSGKLADSDVNQIGKALNLRNSRVNRGEYSSKVADNMMVEEIQKHVDTALADPTLLAERKKEAQSALKLMDAEQCEVIALLGKVQVTDRSKICSQIKAILGKKGIHSEGETASE